MWCRCERHAVAGSAPCLFTAFALVWLEGSRSGNQIEEFPIVHFVPRNRSALKMTETELRLIAKAAIIGDSNQPVNG